MTVYLILSQIEVKHVSVFAPDVKKNKHLNKMPNVIESDRLKRIMENESYIHDDLSEHKNDYGERNILNITPAHYADGKGLSQASSLGSRDYLKNYYDLNGEYTGNIPDADSFIILVKNEYIDLFYKFNTANLPVTTRMMGSLLNPKDQMYLKYIKKDIAKWNDIFEMYYQDPRKYLEIIEIKPVFIKETEDEFDIKVNAYLRYKGKGLFLELCYFGSVDRSDDFLNGGKDVYIIQLYYVRQISREDYMGTAKDFELTLDQIYNSKIRGGNGRSVWQGTPFRTLADDMDYVHQVEKMHKNELD